MTHGDLIFESRTNTKNMIHTNVPIAVTAQVGGFYQMFTTFFMTIFVLFDREKYRTLTEMLGNVYTNVKENPEFAFIKLYRKIVGENKITKTIFTTIFGSYDNNCDVALTTLNILVYIMLIKDIANTMYNNPRMSLSDAYGHEDVVMGVGNTVNWLFKDVYDMRTVTPSLVEIVKEGFTTVSPSMRNSLSSYLAANSPTFGSIIKPLFAYAPKAFDFLFYSEAYKQAITLPAASFLSSIGFASCQKYFQAAGRRRKTRKGKGHRVGTRKRRV